MKILFGTDKWDDKKPVKRESILDTSKTINNHMMIVGGSGSGKTHNLRKIVRALAKDPKNEIHILDVHGDIDIGDDITDKVKFSETELNGLQPLEISADKDYGGVRKRIRSFVNLINRTSRKLGTKQEPVLMYFMQDLYAVNGFYMDRPDSWDINKDVRRNPKFKKKYPTIRDLKRFAEFKYKQMFTGTNSETIEKLEEYNRKMSALQRGVLRVQKGEDLNLEEQKDEIKQVFNDFVDSIENGMEIDELMKYDSKEVVKSVYEKLVSLESTGIFKDDFPTFDKNKPVKRYDIKSLAKDEQLMFVDILLEQIFLLAKQKGIRDEADTYIVIDEAHMFISQEDTHIINILAKEARKFGIGLILASQSFTHFSDDIIQSTSIKIILGIDEMFRKGSAQKLQVDPKDFGYIIPHETAMIQIKNKGSMDNKFWSVRLGTNNNIFEIKR